MKYSYDYTSSGSVSFPHNVTYTYRTNGQITDSLVSGYTSNMNGAVTQYNYTYDGANNIVKAIVNGVETRYVYDHNNQLIREDNGSLSKTYVYNYDNAGNLLSKATYALTAASATPTNPISTVTYGYSAATGDRLTSYNGAAITYDAIGNPLSYNNGTAYTFTWQGRFMQTATVGGQTYTFTYNEEGS